MLENLKIALYSGKWYVFLLSLTTYHLPFTTKKLDKNALVHRAFAAYLDDSRIRFDGDGLLDFSPDECFQWRLLSRRFLTF